MRGPRPALAPDLPRAMDTDQHLARGPSRFAGTPMRCGLSQPSGGRREKTVQVVLAAAGHGQPLWQKVFLQEVGRLDFQPVTKRVR